MSKLVLTLDSSQLEAFGNCPMRWNLSYNERIGLIGQYKDALLSGTAGHRMLEIYYKSRAEGMPPHIARDKALAEEIKPGIKFIITTDGKARFLEGNETVEEPISFALDNPNYELVKQRFRDYYITWAANDFIPRDPKEVEIGFSEQIYEDSEKIYVLEGRIDLLAHWQGLDPVIDNKFQMRKRELYGKSIQFRNYSMITGRRTFVVNYVRLTKKVDDTTYQRQVISFTPDELKWWRGQVKLLFDKVACSLMSNKEQERKWTSCAGKYGYPCEFTRYCEETMYPQVAANIKSQYYQIKPRWSPWDLREAV